MMPQDAGLSRLTGFEVGRAGRPGGVLNTPCSSSGRGPKLWNDNGVLVFHTKNGKVSEAWLHPGDQYAGDEFFS